MTVRHRLARMVHTARGAHIDASAHVPLRSRFSSHTAVGANTWINGAAVCKGGGPISIGPHCAIGQDLLITTTDHDMRRPNMMLRLHWQHGFVDLDSAREVSIGPACWIGDRVTVLGGARIGTGVVIAAGSVVRRGEYPDYAVLAGVPARVVRLRADPGVVATLVEAKWWDWPQERVARNKAFFEADISATDATQLSALIRD